MKNSKFVVDMKPVEYFQGLLDAVEKTTKRKKASAKERFKVLKGGEPMCFLLFSGTCVASRDEDGLVISKIVAPNLFGINQLLPPEMNVVLEAATDIEYIQLSQEDFLNLVEEQQLWKNVSYVQMYLASTLYDFLRKNSGVSTYKLICNSLYALSNEDFETRAMTSAVEYIKERTFLSRSGIMNILADLKAGGHIVIKRGLLIKINNLPDKY